MSWTWRPSRPPLALTSSAQICAPSSACLPLAASGPVKAMPKPILIGRALCESRMMASAGEIRAAPIPAFTPRRVMRLVMGFLQKRFLFVGHPPALGREAPDGRVSATGCPGLALVKRERAWQSALAFLKAMGPNRRWEGPTAGAFLRRTSRDPIARRGRNVGNWRQGSRQGPDFRIWEEHHDSTRTARPVAGRDTCSSGTAGRPNSKTRPQAPAWRHRLPQQRRPRGRTGAAPAPAAPAPPSAAAALPPGSPLIERPDNNAAARKLAPVPSPPLAAPADKLPLAKLKLPKGFKIEIYVSGIPDARSMRFGDKGTLFVGNRVQDKVYADRRQETANARSRSSPQASIVPTASPSRMARSTSPKARKSTSWRRSRTISTIRRSRSSSTAISRTIRPMAGNSWRSVRTTSSM